MAKDLPADVTPEEQAEVERLSETSEWALFNPTDILAHLRKQRAEAEEAAKQTIVAKKTDPINKNILPEDKKNPPTHDPETLFREVLAAIVESTKYKVFDAAWRSWRWAPSKDGQLIRMEWPASVNSDFLKYLDQEVIDPLWPNAEFQIEEVGLAALLKKLSGKRVVSFCCQDEWLLKVYTPNADFISKEYVDLRNGRVRITDVDPRVVFFGCRGITNPRTIRVGMRLVVAEGARDIFNPKILEAKSITIVGFKDKLVVCLLEGIDTGYNPPYNRTTTGPNTVFLVSESSLHNIFEEPNVAV